MALVWIPRGVRGWFGSFRRLVGRGRGGYAGLGDVSDGTSTGFPALDMGMSVRFDEADPDVAEA